MLNVSDVTNATESEGKVSCDLDDGGQDEHCRGYIRAETEGDFMSI